MSLLTGPTRQLVGAAAWFPEAFGPGVFALLLLTVFWLLTTRGRQLWDHACRAVAVTVDLAVGCLLLPEYVVTSTRRRSGQAPGAATRVTGDVFERVLDGAVTLYARHDAPDAHAVMALVTPPLPGGHRSPPPPVPLPATRPGRPGSGPTQRPFPWRLAAIVVLVPVAAWVLRDQAPTSPMADWVDRAWSYWADLEAWSHQ
jgi:hypothetical protein